MQHGELPGLAVDGNGHFCRHAQRAVGYVGRSKPDIGNFSPTANPDGFSGFVYDKPEFNPCIFGGSFSDAIQVNLAINLIRWRCAE